MEVVVGAVAMLRPRLPEPAAKGTHVSCRVGDGHETENIVPVELTVVEVSMDVPVATVRVVAILLLGGGRASSRIGGRGDSWRSG